MKDAEMNDEVSRAINRSTYDKIYLAVDRRISVATREFSSEFACDGLSFSFASESLEWIFYSAEQAADL